MKTEENRKIIVNSTHYGNHRWNRYTTLSAGDGNDSSSNNGVFLRWQRTNDPPNLLSAGNTMWLKIEIGKYWYYRQNVNFTALSVPINGGC